MKRYFVEALLVATGSLMIGVILAVAGAPAWTFLVVGGLVALGIVIVAPLRRRK